ncbi:MAG: hypothetical protein V1644_01355, partial [Candidatus Micrarchaeota archaeon]
EKIISVFNNADYLVVNTHGTGFGFYSITKKGIILDALLGSDIKNNVNNPGLQVSSFACYGGAIDKDNENKAISKNTSIAFAFLQSGAAMLLGNTRFSSGDLRVNTEHNAAMLFAIINKDSRPAGDIVNEYRNAQLNKEFIYKLSALSRQIYGDPLLSFYKAS